MATNKYKWENVDLSRPLVDMDVHKPILLKCLRHTTHGGSRHAITLVFTCMAWARNRDSVLNDEPSLAPFFVSPPLRYR